MKLHPGAWLVWLAAVAVFAYAVSDPLYVLLGLGVVLLVHLAFPATDGVRAVRMFVIGGCVLLMLRLVLVVLAPNPGTTVIFTLPHIDLPRFLGGLSIGGPVNEEVVAASFVEGLRLILVLAAFGVFNAHADVASLVRSVPSVFRDAGLVVSIAFAFVPGMLRTVRDVRDAQRLRDERGFRRLAPSLAVPVLGLSLERALLLAESMDARGYGGASSTNAGRTTLVGGLVALLASIVAWAAGWHPVATVLALAGVVAVVWSLREAAAASGTTRYFVSKLRAIDGVVMAVSLVVLVLASRIGGSYNPYPRFSMPAFSVGAALFTLLLAAPALAGSL